MLEFLKKFFGYFDNDGIMKPYNDYLGHGAFSDYRHFIWMFLTIIICVFLYLISKRFPSFGKKFIIISMILLFSVRVISQIIKACIGAEVPAWQAFPFHMCTVLTYLLPIVSIFNIKKMKTPVYVLAMMGGIITIIVGDYFESRFITFATLEGMTAHMLLIIVPLIEIAMGNFQLEWKKSWQVVLFIAILTGWATLANEVFFKNYETNYMYLVKNALPGNIGGKYFFLVYVAIFFFLLVVIFGTPQLYRYIKRKKGNR